MSAPRVTRRRYRRHSAEVTADRLRDALERWHDKLDPRERDDFSYVIHILEEIAEGLRSDDGGEG